MTLLQPFRKKDLPVVENRLQSVDAFRLALLQMLQDQQATFVKSQEDRQKAFDESLHTKQQLMKIKYLEDERQFRRDLKSYRKAADSWELAFTETFSKAETEREKEFLEAEKLRETAFLQTNQEQQEIFGKMLQEFQTTFYALVEEVEKKAYEQEGIRLRNILDWGHVKRDEVKKNVKIWQGRFAAAEERREVRFNAFLDSVDMHG